MCLSRTISRTAGKTGAVSLYCRTACCLYTSTSGVASSSYQRRPPGHLRQGSHHLIHRVRPIINTMVQELLHLVNRDRPVIKTRGRLIILSTGIARSSGHQHQGSPRLINKDRPVINARGRLIVSPRGRRKDISRDRCKQKRLGLRKIQITIGLKPCPTGLPLPESPP